MGCFGLRYFRFDIPLGSSPKTLESSFRAILTLWAYPSPREDVNCLGIEISWSRLTLGTPSWIDSIFVLQADSLAVR